MVNVYFSEIYNITAFPKLEKENQNLVWSSNMLKIKYLENDEIQRKTLQNKNSRDQVAESRIESVENNTPFTVWQKNCILTAPVGEMSK